MVLLLGTLFLYPKLNCAVSIPPLKAYVDAIGDGEVSTTVMVPPGHSPHSYEPKPSQMRALDNADCYFAVGVEFEKAWLPRFRAQNPKIKIIDLSQGISKYPMVAHKGEGEHGGETRDSKEKRAHLDPHIWTAPSNVKIMAKHIYETLASLDPAHRELFEKNYRNFLAKIDATDHKIRQRLSSLPPHSAFMVFHPSWGYFAREYGLRQLPVEVEGKAPKPRQLMRLIEEARREKVRAIFVQPEFSDKSARILAQELKIPVVKLSPLSKDWSDTLLRLADAIAQRTAK